MSLAEIRGLRVVRGAQRHVAVDALDLTLLPGESVALVGESGSGKSTVALALMGLVQPAAGQVLWRGRDLGTLAAEALRALRGREVALVPQDPQGSLSPAVRVGVQVAEVAETHLGLRRPTALERAERLLEQVGVPPRALRAWPHELSGGQRQRVALAMALIAEPALLVADEPTTALDAVTQAEVLGLLRALRAERQLALLFITHDLGVAAEVSERLVVMCDGRAVEAGRTTELLARPQHPVTRALVAAAPRLPLGASPLGSP